MTKPVQLTAKIFCLIFYMSFIEVAPHNKGKEKEYDFVAGCLIAYACKLSFIEGKNHHEGYLTFDVMEADENDQFKLMAMYSKKYKACRVPFISDTTMIIKPQDAMLLIEEYLNRV
jgi:hypothetical protein